jgi:hypothetical protein
MKSAEQQNKEYELRLEYYLSKLSKAEYDNYTTFQNLSQSLQYEDLVGEYWVELQEGCGFYSISNYSRIRRENAYVKGANGISMFWQGKIIRQRKQRGYYALMICVANVKKGYRIHRLFGKYFIENICGLPFINHNNGIRHDNRPENLTWCNNSENQKHSYSNLDRKPSTSMLGKTGKLCPTSKSILQFGDNGNFIREWDSIADAGRSMNLLNNSAFSRACKTGCIAYGYYWKFKEVI